MPESIFLNMHFGSSARDPTSTTALTMATVVNVPDYFDAARVGVGLGSLYDVDSLTWRLRPALDEQGHRPLCPITMQSMTRNAALIQDGGVYQFGAIREWLGRADTSPLTGLQIPHSRILKLSSMVDVVECFLSTCRERRATSNVRRVGEFEQLRSSRAMNRAARYKAHLMISRPTSQRAGESSQRGRVTF